MALLTIFSFSKCKFVFGILHCTEDNFGKQTEHKMKEGSMPDEQLKTILENNASSVMRITVHYLHYALTARETKIP